MGIFSFLFGCKNKTNESQQTDNGGDVQLEEITSRIDPEEGWFDIYMKIVSEIRTDSSYVYTVKGLYKGNTVGLQIEVRSDIGAGIVNGSVSGGSGFLADGVTLRSIGSESDNLVTALAELYNVSATEGFTKQPIASTIFSLNSKAVDLSKAGYYKLKLFYEIADEELYAELFLNINTETKEIELHEKDQEYRSSLIKIWTK